MKTSELIERLQLILKERGDFTVVTGTDHQDIVRTVNSCDVILYFHMDGEAEACVKISNIQRES